MNIESEVYHYCDRNNIRIYTGKIMPDDFPDIYNIWTNK